MKVLIFSLDKKSLEAGTAVYERLRGYAVKLERLWVVAPSLADLKVQPGANAEFFGVGGGKILSWLKMYFLTGSLIRRQRPDVISVQDQYFLAGLAWLLSRRFRIGWEMQVHGFEKMGGLRAAVFRFLVKRADSVRTVSRRFKNELVDKYQVVAEKVTVVPIRTPAAPALARRNTGGNFIFLGVGRLVRVKRFDLLIEAFAGICAQAPGAVLWIAGIGEDMGKLRRMIKEKGLGERVRLLGWQDDLEDIWAQAGAFVLSSDSEGWGMVVIEAMQAGVPVVMTDVGLAGEVVQDGASGLVVPVGDHRALGQAMLRLFTDAGLRERLAQGGLQALARLPDEDATWELYKESWGKAKSNYQLSVKN